MQWRNVLDKTSRNYHTSSNKGEKKMMQRLMTNFSKWVIIFHSLNLQKDIPDEKADLMRSPHQQYERTCTFFLQFSFPIMLLKKPGQPSWRIRRSPARLISSKYRPFSTPDWITLVFAFSSKSDSCSSALSRSSYLNFSAKKLQEAKAWSFNC